MPALTPLEPWIAGKIGCDRLTRSALAAYQLEKVRATLALVRARSPFYRRWLAYAPAEIDSLDALEEFPFTTADDLRQHPTEFLCVSQGEIRRVATLNTSGTTGTPKRIFQTAEDQELTLDFFQVGMFTFVTPGQRVLILLPGERPGSVGDLLAAALGRLGALGVKHGPVSDVAAAVQRLQQASVDCVVGVPTHVLALVQAAPAVRLQSVLLTTDHVPDALRHTVEQQWGCAVYNHYGMTEMGLGGGVDCQARRGCHLREADLYVEIVDPQTGRRVQDGEAGEIVFTTLTRRGMPLLRYRTGDLGRLVPGACPCGTILATLAHVKNRVSRAAHPLALSDLDEALFSIRGVSNFAAALAGGELQVQVELAADVPLDVLQAALHAIPAVQARGLTVSVTAQRGHELLYAQGMHKRTLAVSGGAQST